MRELSFAHEKDQSIAELALILAWILVLSRMLESGILNDFGRPA